MNRLNAHTCRCGWVLPEKERPLANWDCPDCYHRDAQRVVARADRRPTWALEEFRTEAAYLELGLATGCIDALYQRYLSSNIVHCTVKEARERGLTVQP